MLLLTDDDYPQRWRDADLETLAEREAMLQKSGGWSSSDEEKEKIMRFLKKAAVFLLVVIGLLQINPLTYGQGETPNEYNELLEKAQNKGTVMVIVGLNLPTSFEAEGDLQNKDAIEAQRNRIATTQENLLLSLREENAEAYAVYETIPAMALKVDEKALRILIESSLVETIQEDVPLPLTLGSSTSVIGMPTVWGDGHQGAGQTVVILDTGIEANHSFFGGRVVTEACFSNAGGAGGQTTLCPNGGSSQTGSGAANANTSACFNGSNQLCNHGTHVAGIAAGNGSSFDGVARGANIIAIQVFTRFNSASSCENSPPCVLTYSSDQISALEYTYNTLRSSYSIASVNMSLGGGQYTDQASCDADNSSKKAAIDNLRSVGIATVISAGNDGWTNAMGAPGCISSAVGVAATTDDDSVASFSNMHQMVDLNAPGESIESSVTGGSYANYNGTSMAAPHVAGAWAVLKAIQPSATVDDILTAFQSTGVDVTDTRSGGSISKPRIQVDAAVGDSCGPFFRSEPQEIPDDGSWLEVSLVDRSAPTGGVVDEVYVKYLLDHPDPKQLEVELAKVNSEVSYALWSQGEADTPSFGSALGIDAFNGVPAEGEWQLRVRDLVPGGQGRLTAVSVRAHYAPVGALPQIVAGTPGRPTSLSIPDGALASDTPNTDPAKSATEGEDMSALGWQIIKSETFEGAFPDSSWSVSDISNDDCEFLWDDDDFKPHNGGWAGWPADAGADGLDPATSNYPPNMNSWMIYGPFDLSDASDADTLFWMWREIETNHDQLFFGVSSDGANFNGYTWDGSADWEQLQIGYSNYTGDSSVWVGWAFQSDDSVQYDGPWIDDIQIRKFQGDGCNFSNPVTDASVAEMATLPPEPQPYAIMIQSGSFVPEPGLTPSDRQGLLDQAAQLETQGENRRIHALIQFSQIPNNAERERLSEQGIELLRYIPDRTWLTSFPIERLDQIATLSNVRWIGEWSVERKVEPALLNGEYSSWSYAPEEDLLALIVQFPKDVTIERGRQLVRKHDGVVRSDVESINALVVWIKSDELASLAAEDEVEWIEQVSPAMSPLNDCVRPRVGANTLHATPYNLDGTGIDLLVYDGGTVDTSHQAFSGRLTIGDTDGVSEHGTHVAGTAAGDGAGSPSGRDLKGVAPDADVISYGYERDGTGTIFHDDPGDIDANWNQAKNTHGADLGTASLGSNVASNGFPCNLEGNYGASSQLLDEIVRGSVGEPYVMTWAAGNERGDGSCGTEYNTTAPPSGAKNPIQVGATNSDTDLMTSFSSWGPTDDGRLKPIIAAPGCEAGSEGSINSTEPPNDYGGKCGTSMATPAVAGIVTLMLEQYRSTYNTSGEFLPSTAKAILAHTAVDRGNPGPDYQYGYGRVDGVSAIDAIIAGDFGEETFDDQGQEHTFIYSFSGSISELRVTLAWDDPSASLAATTQLVNNLDLVLIAPNGTSHRPFVLNPAQPGNTATTGIDNLNNQEQVIVSNPTAGTWIIKVTATALPDGAQNYSLVFPGARTATSLPMSLQLGWNKIAFAVDPLVAYTAQDACDEIDSQGGNALEINRWRAGGWEGHVCGETFNNFDLVLGSSYFIKSDANSSWTIQGTTVTTPTDLTLQLGWNSIGIPHTSAYTAESLCAEIISQGVTALEIDRWHNGGWDGHICGQPFNDFQIERGVGYFVKSSSAGTVTPNTAASRPD